MDINYELYKVFYHVASSLSFSDASKKLFISQSAVSQSIKTLERKLGQPLFIRSTKKVQLTPAGALLLKHVEPAMNLISRGESRLLESGLFGFRTAWISVPATASAAIFCCRICRNSIGNSRMFRLKSPMPVRWAV